MTRAVRAELLKIRTINVWWLMAIGLVAFTALALLINSLEAHFTQFSHQSTPTGMSPDDQAQFEQQEQRRYNEAHTVAGAAKIAANLYTSGQFFGVMLLLVLGALVVTNEFFHQTATATFLATPHRTTVIMAKLVTATLLGFGGWLLTTVINLTVGFLYLRSEGVPSSFGHRDVAQSVALNLAAFVMWSILGVALGVLIRSQIASVVTGIVVYPIGFAPTSIVFSLIHT